MQDIRKYIDISSRNSSTPQVGDAIYPEFGDNTAVILTTIEKIGEDPVVLADDKALDFILKLEEVCGCEMEEEHEEEHPDHEVNMGKSRCIHEKCKSNPRYVAKSISEREGIEGWVAMKKSAKDYLEYVVQRTSIEAVNVIRGLVQQIQKIRNNGDEPPAGMLRAYIDTGILTDGVEAHD